MKYGFYPFMEMRNSSLLRVCLIRSLMNSIASTGFISARYFRSTHIRCITFSSSSKSSRRVLEEVKSIAGKILRLEIFLSNCSYMLPVPLNSSKITSSILDPVSVRAVAMMVKEPPFSIFRAAPKKRFGL